MVFTEKLDFLIKNRGITRTQLAKDINVSEGTIRSWYKNSQPTLDKLLKLSHYFAISLDELTGNNSFFRYDMNILNDFYSLSDVDQEKVRHFIEVANTHKHTYITSIGYEAIKQTPSMVAEESPKYNIKSIPVRGYVAAGKPIMAIDNHFDDIEVSNNRIDFALIVNGNSMDPLIKDGAYVYVQSCEQLENGEIGVFMINNDVTCKKFFQNDVMIKLISINPAYEDMVFMLKDPHNEHLNFKIEGRVIL